MAKPDPGKPGDRRPPVRPREQLLQQVTAYTGQAAEWVPNDDYVYDGFYLQNQQGKWLVKFPPHIGISLTKAIKTGAAVTVNMSCGPR